MTVQTKQHPTGKTRLKFIDLARSIAILLMLEGHFIDDSLMDIYRDNSYTAYRIWEFIRGFTSPTFLTVTGIVFVYLLMGNNHIDYFKNMRVKKGFKRVVELLFWGYLLQVYAFHVLQCIGIGILFILLIYGLFKLLKIVPLWFLFFLAGTAVFSLNLYFIHFEESQYWPTNAPGFIQNMFRGKYSIFPIIPRMGYTMYGAMFGSLLFQYKEKVKSWGFPLIVFFTGAIFYFFIKAILVYADRQLGLTYHHIYRLDWLYECLGMVFMLIGTLMIVEKLMGEIKQSLFLKMGQNTLTVYILHMVVLYGSLTGFGVNKFFHKALTPYQLIPAVIAFIALFFVIVYYLEAIKEKLEFVLKPIREINHKLFGLTSKEN
jgi:uncharacterized membrane protein